MEYDWSDKKEAHEIEAINCHLTNKSTTTLFKPGATRYPNEYETSVIYSKTFTITTVYLL